MALVACVRVKISGRRRGHARPSLCTVCSCSGGEGVVVVSVELECFWIGVCVINAVVSSGVNSSAGIESKFWQRSDCPWFGRNRAAKVSALVLWTKRVECGR